MRDAVVDDLHGNEDEHDEYEFRREPPGFRDRPAAEPEHEKPGDENARKGDMFEDDALVEGLDHAVAMGDRFRVSRRGEGPPEGGNHVVLVSDRRGESPDAHEDDVQELDLRIPGREPLPHDGLPSTIFLWPCAVSFRRPAACGSRPLPAASNAAAHRT